MADSNLPRQDFAPPWLKFPSDTVKSSNQKPNAYQGERNRPRREDPYYSRSDFNRLHRQSSFDFHEGKRFPPGPNKYRHHSVDDDFGGYSYGYGYYAANYNYEKYGMHFSSQPSLARSASRDAKFPPGRLNQMNGNAILNGPHDLFEPYYQQGSKRGYRERDSHRDVRNGDGKDKDKVSEKDRPFTDDFPSLNGSGEAVADSKTKPGSGVWENPPKSASKNEESADLLKNSSSPGIYKALVPSKNNQAKKPIKEVARVNGSVREISPLSPSNKSSHKEGSRYSPNSPTPDLAIVTQPKKLGDKKSDFLRAIRNESSIRNGDFQNQNQNLDKKQDCKQDIDVDGKETIPEYSQNGEREVDTNENVVSGKNGDLNGETTENYINGDVLINYVDHITLSGEEEERRLLLSMGWVEEDKTEYVITEDEIREFQNLVQKHCHGQKNGLKSSLRSARDRKIGAISVLNGIPSEEEKFDNKLL